MASFTPGEYKPSISDANNGIYFISKDPNKANTSFFGNTSKPIGYWILPGSDPVWKVKFTAYKKPRWLTRKFMEHVLEWKWENA